MTLFEQWIGFTKQRWSMKSAYTARKKLDQLDNFIKTHTNESIDDVIDIFGISEARSALKTVTDIDKNYLKPLGISKYLSPNEDAEMPNAATPGLGVEGDIGRDPIHNPADMQHTHPRMIFSPVVVTPPQFPRRIVVIDK